ncbi:hypothetical protein RDI58_012117 [Solanum bulbocastanum]|uniref:Uncharacterized protein n=1 Tax=Solanum bulbocastanum TaxID=147425 RepID=A0AAN8TWZ5_SOLBU
MKQHFRSEIDDVFNEQIKFGLFSLNFLVVSGTFGLQCYDGFFKESTKETVQLTIKQLKKVRNGVPYVSKPNNFISLYFQFHY